MRAFLELLRRNRNYRYTWTGQVVSEIGDHFNNIAVFSLVMKQTGSGKVVSAVLLARGLAVIAAGPLAGVALDRLDRRQLMIASDLVRAVVAMGFSFCLVYPAPWLMYLMSAMLMFASPFFTSGRAAILPRIASPGELHTANSLTQTTQWTSLAVGTMLGGVSVAQFGYEWAFLFNAISFAFSALCISKLHVAGGFRARAAAGVGKSGQALTEQRVLRPWHEYTEGLRYMRSHPLIFGLGLLGVGWALGGGAAQILFTLFGEVVFAKGAAGIGAIWGCAAIGLLAGGTVAHRIGPRLSFGTYKWLVALCYLLHGGSYMLFSQMKHYGLALLFIALSRASVGVTSVLNMTQLLRHVDDNYRGRVFSTFESMTWAMMMLSMTACGFASDYLDPRTIGLWSGLLSTIPAFFWAWANLAGKLPEPEVSGVEPDEIEVHGDPQQ